MNHQTASRIQNIAVIGVAAALAAGFVVHLLSALELGKIDLATLPGQISLHTAFITRAVQETGSMNVVSAILMDYRGFDTFGEATVIFTAVAVAATILGKPKLTQRDGTMGLLSRRLLSAVLPLFFLFPMYVIIHGHISPGGGFQGGVSLAVLIILIHVAFGMRFGQHIISLRVMSITEYTAALMLLSTGFFGITQGVSFLSNYVAGAPQGTPGQLFSAGIIPLLNFLVGFKVAAGLGSLYIYLSGHESIAEESSEIR